MTEMEAVEVLKEEYRTKSMYIDAEDCKRHNQAISMAISALEEVQQFRELGTVEELKKTMEKQRAKKQSIGYCQCLVCGKIYQYRIPRFCFRCGAELGEEPPIKQGKIKTYR